jgi:hypothetical protein
MRQHKIWVDVTGGSGKSFGCGSDNSIKMNICVGNSASNSRNISTIKIERWENDGNLEFEVIIDGQRYRREGFNIKEKEFRGIDGYDISGDVQKEDQRNSERLESIMKTTAMVAAMGSFFTDTKKESNDWKERMIKAGLSDKGLIMPENWNELTDDEKETRLNNVIKTLSA